MFIVLIKVKTPTIVGILISMSRINFVLSLVEHGKHFYNLGASVGIDVAPIKQLQKCVINLHKFKGNHIMWK